MEIVECAGDVLSDLREFLSAADLTLSGLGAPGVRLWVALDEGDRIIGSTGFELSDDGRHALIRSVAVDPAHRSRGMGGDLARFALARATDAGARTAWLFSRRSGPFWRSLGFSPAERDTLAEVLADTQQVRLFQRTAQLATEIAWSRTL
ncbi:GNAT family N-acetyltransferase [Microbacterium sp. HMH0099]|uniref:GNAT family N-acetyltransferase n=1 Tax=Microbacterium sp. HMH0099 TaxID=3414026 RepID=UPI003BF75480